MTRCFAFVIALVAASACGGAPSASPETAGHGASASGPAAVQPAEELVGLFEQLAGQLRGQTDCDRFAETLGAWTRQHGERYTELASSVDGDALRPYQGRIRDALEAVVSSGDACRESARATSAFEEFDRLLEAGER